MTNLRGMLLVAGLLSGAAGCAEGVDESTPLTDTSFPNDAGSESTVRIKRERLAIDALNVTPDSLDVTNATPSTDTRAQIEVIAPVNTQVDAGTEATTIPPAATNPPASIPPYPSTPPTTPPGPAEGDCTGRAEGDICAQPDCQGQTHSVQSRCDRESRCVEEKIKCDRSCDRGVCTADKPGNS